MVAGASRMRTSSASATGSEAIDYSCCRPTRGDDTTWPPAAVRTRRFWLAVAPGSPLVFGSVALAIVVLPEEVTSARTLLAGFAGLMTALSFAAGVAVQSFARRLRDMLAGTVAGLGCAAAGCAAGIAAVSTADRVLVGVAAVLLGLAYGLCLVWGCGRPSTWPARMSAAP